jgi:hypothetical protein
MNNLYFDKAENGENEEPRAKSQELEAERFL